MSTGYRQLEHTADLALEIWAGSEQALFAEGARALIEIMTEGEPQEGVDRRQLEVDALDAEDRLVRWLNEILVLAVAEGFLFTQLERLELRDGGLTAAVLGKEGAGDRIRAELKSVTYHDLLLAREADGWRARVVIDV